MRNSERLKVSFLFQPFTGPSFSSPPPTWPFTTLPWHRHSNIENSQTFINQIFFSVLLSFFSPSTEGYIWFLLLWRVFSAQSIVKKDSGVCVCVCAYGHGKKYSENCCLKFSCSFFQCFHLIKLKVDNIQTYPSLIDSYTAHRARSIYPLPDSVGPGQRWWKKNRFRRVNSQTRGWQCFKGHFSNSPIDLQVNGWEGSVIVQTSASSSSCPSQLLWTVIDQIVKWNLMLFSGSCNSKVTQCAVLEAL